MARRAPLRAALLAVLMLTGLWLLSGCLISSGVRESSSQAPGGAGNLRINFVSSDSLGQSGEQTIQATQGRTLMDIIVSARVQRGLLLLEVLNPDGTVALSLEARANEQLERVRVSTDNEGRIHYRVRTNEARNGSYQLIYSPAPPPTATPTPTPTPEPTPELTPELTPQVTPTP